MQRDRTSVGGSAILLFITNQVRVVQWIYLLMCLFGDLLAHNPILAWFIDELLICFLSSY